MIIKKLYRATKCKSWNNQRKVFEEVSVVEYIGWFLFGIIPIYLIVLDKYTEVNYADGGGSGTIRDGIIGKYQYLMLDHH